MKSRASWRSSAAWKSLTNRTAVSIGVRTLVVLKTPLSRLGSSPKTTHEGLVLLCHNHVHRTTTGHRYRRISPSPQSVRTARSAAVQQTRSVPPRPSLPRLLYGQRLPRHPVRLCLWNHPQAACCDDTHRRTSACTMVGGLSHPLSALGRRLAICRLRRAIWDQTTVSENPSLNIPFRRLIHIILIRGRLVRRLLKHQPFRMVRRSSS